MNEQHTVKRANAARRRVRTLRVEVVEGPDRGSAAQGSGPLTVGTAAGNSLVLHDRTVSRYHVELCAAPGGVRVADVGSLNGTWLGATRLREGMVPAKTTLTLGQSRIEVTDGSEEARDPPAASIPGFVAQSTQMKTVASEVLRLAATHVSVLVRGETGTGKEVVARALHELGDRRGGALEIVDCGSMPSTLIASELFGHERGAFTGADRRHVGAFERAHGGTLFLDEIGELPMQVQPSLLGALERRCFRRVGGTQEIAVDVRVVAATHRDLRAEVNADRFRADLYYRLAVARILIPPLREHPEDIEPLVRLFVTEMTGTPELPFGEVTLDALRAHRWSGNVRELRNVVEAAVAMGEVRIDATRPGVGAARGSGPDEPLLAYKEARGEAIAAFERTYLGRLIDRCGGNASQASRLARMDRQYLLRLLRKHGLR